MKRLRPNENGSLLLTSLLIILVLAGLGIMAVRNVILELKLVGNQRIGETTLYVTESGVDSVVALAVSRGDAFPAFVLANQNRVNMTDVSDPFFDLTSTSQESGSFGKDIVGVGNVNFVSQLTLPVDTNRVPGYPVSENFIWKKYKITTSGYYGDQVVLNPDDVLRNGARQFVSYSFIGPFVIGGGGQ